MCSRGLILSGLLHGVAYLVDGGPWEGPLPWCKPIVFGLSFGVTLATVACILPFLRQSSDLGTARRSRSAGMSSVIADGSDSSSAWSPPPLAR